MKKEQTYTLEEFPFPDSIRLEQQLIAELVFCPEETHEARRLLKPEMFSNEQCRKAWELICTYQDRGQQADAITLSQRLGKEFVAGRIIPLAAQVGSGMNIQAHCALLAEQNIRKRAYEFSLRMLKVSSDNTLPAVDLLSLPEDFTSSVRADLGAETDSVSITDAINSLAETLEKEQEDRAKGRPTRIPTSIPSLDTMTYGGFGPGQLIILAARPSVGKTAIALSMARAAAIAGVPATIFSLEMTKEELAQRILFSTGLVKPQQLIGVQKDWDGFESAAGRFDKAPLSLNDSAKTIEEITTRIILNSQQGKCGIAFIDYLGLLDFPSSGKMPLYQQIAAATKIIKQTAKKCRIPIVLLCQLNRASASDNRPPQLYDLRDSGSIEQDADIVIMLERPSSEESQLNMWIRKNRQGKAGNIYIELEPDSTYTNFIEKGVKRA